MRDFAPPNPRYAALTRYFEDSNPAPQQLKSVRQRRTDFSWRRGRDLNPRYGCPHTAFRERLLQPLGHLSRSAYSNLRSVLAQKELKGIVVLASQLSQCAARQVDAEATHHAGQAQFADESLHVFTGWDF